MRKPNWCQVLGGASNASHSRRSMVPQNSSWTDCLISSLSYLTFLLSIVSGDV